MSDRAVLAMTLAAALGAWLCPAVPLVVAVPVVAVGLAWRRPAVVVVGAALLTAALGARAWAGLDPPAPTSVHGSVTLLTDPDDDRGAVRVDVRVGRRRVEAWARGEAASALRLRLAGERVVLAGRLRAPPPHARAWLARRHVGARLSVDRVEGWSHGHAVTRAANAFRRTLAGGARSLAPDRRTLFTGMVLGDDRGQSALLADDFRAAGLTHLLAVSGQNVAFVLALAGPALRRLPLRGRWAASVAVVAFFAVVTRGEPSVLRASALAMVAVTAATAGRPASRLRLLALAVTALLVVDPFLVRSVGFLLSVGASAGIVVLAAPLVARLPGPRPVASALAVTIAAQVGVAPVLVPVFGGLPVASVPANLLAVPAAGPVMMWGLTGGVAAGVLGEPVARWLHLPTSVLVGWVAAVARWAAGLPLGQVRASHGVVLAAGVVVSAAWRVVGRRPTVPILTTVIALLVVLLRPASMAAADRELVPGAALWRSDEGGVVVVVEGAHAGRLLEALRATGVRRVDVLVAPAGDRASATTVADVRRRVTVRLVLAPEGHRIRDAVTPPPAAHLAVGGVQLVVGSVAPTLEIDVRLAGGRSPPGR